jgi:hypothetical protein
MSIMARGVLYVSPTQIGGAFPGGDAAPRMTMIDGVDEVADFCRRSLDGGLWPP